MESNFTTLDDDDAADESSSNPADDRRTDADESGITESDRERIAEFLDSDNPHPNELLDEDAPEDDEPDHPLVNELRPQLESGGSEFVSVEECAAIRRLFRADIAPKHVAEVSNRSNATIHHHARGRCQHTDAEVGVGSVAKGTIGIPVASCHRWRRLVHEQGESSYSLSKESPYARSTIRRHISGGCSHDHDVPPADHITPPTPRSERGRQSDREEADG